MERKFLEELGLEKEAIDKIMTENGKDIESEKAKVTAKDVEITTANGTIKELQDAVKKFDGVDVEKLKNDLITLETKYNTDLSQTKLSNALELALVTGKAKSTKAVKALLDMETIKLDGDKLLGLDDQLTKLKTDSAYLFDVEQDPKKTTAKVDSGKPHQDQPGTGSETLLAALQEKFN